MKILAVETATAWQSVAILEDDLVLAQHAQEANGAHGALLLPAIDHVLVQSGLQLGDLSGLACSVGPGSFTGLRVGIATCLGLRAATGLPHPGPHIGSDGLECDDNHDAGLSDPDESSGRSLLGDLSSGRERVLGSRIG